MFLNIRQFKKLLKNDYKGFGVDVIRFSDGILHVKGLCWAIDVDEGVADKKYLAALIEVLGPLPDPGTGFKYHEENGEEIEVGFKYSEMKDTLLQQYTMGIPVQDTRLMIQYRENCFSVFQTIDTKDPFLVHRGLQILVDPARVDRKKDEIEPEQPVINRDYVIWNNDMMQLAISKTILHNEGERDFLRLINAKDMRWEFDD